jgi:hypothetical protein
MMHKLLILHDVVGDKVSKKSGFYSETFGGLIT